MAKKIDRPVYPEEAAERERAAAAAADTAAEQLLHPSRTLPIAGRTVTLREYGHIEGRRMRPFYEAFLADLYAEYARDEPAPKLDQIDALIDRHLANVHWMVAQSLTPPDDDHPDAFVKSVRANAVWVATLDDPEGDLLLLAWWSVTKRFFTRRLHRMEAAQMLAAAPSASTRSTPH